MNATLEEVLALLGMFFGKNETVVELETLLPEVLNAIAGAKSGSAFSVNFPMSLDGKAGSVAFGWTPAA